MADEYISREAACSAIPDDYYGWRDKQLLKSVPAADVQPVRHGRWLEVKGFTGVEAFGYKEECVDGFVCSICGGEVDVSEGHFRYCPNCGAKMEEKK